MWATDAWTGGELNADYTVPRTPPKPWLTYGHWRSQPEGGISGHDLGVELVDSCASRCEDGIVKLSVRVLNRGPREMDAGIPVALYGIAEDGTRLLIETRALADWLDDAATSPSLEFQVDTAQAKRGVEVVVGDPADDLECLADDNTLRWAWEGCDDAADGGRD
jgi:hypothetical protein